MQHCFLEEDLFPSEISPINLESNNEQQQKPLARKMDQMEFAPIALVKYPKLTDVEVNSPFKQKYFIELKKNIALSFALHGKEYAEISNFLKEEFLIQHSISFEEVLDITVEAIRIKSASLVAKILTIYRHLFNAMFSEQVIMLGIELSMVSKEKVKQFFLSLMTLDFNKVASNRSQIKVVDFVENSLYLRQLLSGRTDCALTTEEFLTLLINSIIFHHFEISSQLLDHKNVSTQKMFSQASDQQLRSLFEKTFRPELSAKQFDKLTKLIDISCPGRTYNLVSQLNISLFNFSKSVGKALHNFISTHASIFQRNKIAFFASPIEENNTEASRFNFLILER